MRRQQRFQSNSILSLAVFAAIGLVPIGLVSTGFAISTLPALAQPAVIDKPVTDKWALVVGISKFSDPSLNLRYPAKDAQDFYNYLVTKGNFARDHVRLLLNEKATKENILD